jgi:hypothetical protein
MRRREFTTLLLGNAAASVVIWPLCVRAQQRPAPVNLRITMVYASILK